MKKLIILITIALVLASVLASGQDSTFKEMTKNQNSPYFQQREAIMEGYRHIQDSVHKVQPKWKDSILRNLSDSNRWKAHVEYNQNIKNNQDSLIKLSKNPAKQALFINSLLAQRILLTKLWQPFFIRLNALNKQHRVVGDSRDQSFYIFDKQ
jgi:hypothetical protein